MSADAAGKDRLPFGPGPIVLGGGALLLSGLLLIGFLLPADWEAEASASIQAPPEVVFRFLDSPEGWREWTTWPDSGLVREGPERGPGASMSWDDPELGTGSFRLVEVRTGELVRYEVEVNEGRMRTEGEIVLTRDALGLHVDWRERGNLGRNPLMGYWALSMDRAQTAELEKGLERLAALAAGAWVDPTPSGAAPVRDPPTDTLPARAP